MSQTTRRTTADSSPHGPLFQQFLFSKVSEHADQESQPRKVPGRLAGNPARILAHAGNRCEGSPAYPDCRAENGKPHPVTGSKVVLTIAHRDNELTDHSDANLAAWCQRCHLTHDAAQHAADARLTRCEQKDAGRPLLKDESEMNILKCPRCKPDTEVKP